MHATPSGYYHLALSYARRGGPTFDLDKAIECAGNAVTGQPNEVRYWHLLGILLTGAQKWAEAKEIFEHGAELDLDDEDDVEETTTTPVENFTESRDALTVTPSQAHTLVVPGVNGSVGFPTEKVNGSIAATIKPTTVKRNSLGQVGNTSSSNGRPTPIPLLELDATELPFADTLLKSKDLDFEGYLPSKMELFEWHLQLRMTQVALMEIIEGAEGAEAGWLDIFSWVAERKGPTSSDGMT